jgi:hypothetical protein
MIAGREQKPEYNTQVKVKQSHYRAGQAQRFAGN